MPAGSLSENELEDLPEASLAGKPVGRMPRLKLQPVGS